MKFFKHFFHAQEWSHRTLLRYMRKPCKHRYCFDKVRQSHAPLMDRLFSGFFHTRALTTAATARASRTASAAFPSAELTDLAAQDQKNRRHNNRNNNDISHISYPF